jgi:hypothetical protein
MQSYANTSEVVVKNVVCVSIFNAAEGLTDDVVTELVKTVEAREKYAKEVRISRTRRELGRHRVEHAEDASAETCEMA